MKKMDQRGQISIEFILILALMAIIVGAIGWYAGNSNEQSIISSAVRSAADNAAATYSLVNETVTPLRVENINTSNNGSTITLYVYISGSNSSQNQEITNSILSSIASQRYNVTNGSIVTNKHIYLINCTTA